MTRIATASSAPRLIGIFAVIVLSALAAPAFAALNVVACEPEWAALTKELGGDRVNVSSATDTAA